MMNPAEPLNIINLKEIERIYKWIIEVTKPSR